MNFAPRIEALSGQSASQRLDIQFLRGIAVLLVVGFHGFREVIPRGFLGVDLFFVLSGYLITGMVLRDLEAGRFTFKTFYLRRAKRLLPAAYSTFIGATLLAYPLLTSPEWSMYLLQLFGAVTFTANVVLSQQTGYFAGAAETKPLLHIWSLSLEEQFYFVIPLALWIVRPRLRFPLIVLTGIGSFLLCLAAVHRLDFQTLAFFMLPTRAWELLAGSCCAWLVMNRGVRVPRAIQWLALVLILATSAIGFDRVHPRGDAVLMVLATSLVLLGSDNWLPRKTLTQAIATIGDWSYSLYLVHWPLFSFAYIAYMGDPPATVLIGLSLLSILLAWLQYRFVETPFRYAWPARPVRAWSTFAAMTAAVGLAAIPAVYAKATGSPPIDLRRNTGLADECAQSGPTWTDHAACRRSPAPSIAVWGDSNAMHLAPGLADLPIIQLTKAACPPILGLADLSATRSPEEARACISFHESAFRRIVDDASIRFVVLSSPFAQYFNNNGQQLLMNGRISEWRDVGPAMLSQTVARLRQAGKVPILVGPMPRGGFNPGACYLRQMEGVLSLGRTDCHIHELEAWYRRVVAQLRSVADVSGAELFLPESAICVRSSCRTEASGVILYRDGGHLTRDGSAYIVRAMGLRDRLIRS